MSRVLKVLVVAVLIYVFYDQGLAFAQEAAAAAEEVEVGDTSLWDSIAGGGTIGFFLIFLSIVAMTLGIENFINLKREKLVPPELVGELETMLDDENIEDAIDLCQAEDCFFTRIIGAGLSKADLGYDAMVSAVDEIGTQEATMIHQKIGWLSLIGNMAPMIGLFGTVTGMIGSFNVIATNPNPKPAEMAGGISMALVTTCLGLVVAIPTVTLYTWLRNRVVKVIMEGGTITTELLDRFRPEE